MLTTRSSRLVLLTAALLGLSGCYVTHGDGFNPPPTDANVIYVEGGILLPDGAVIPIPDAGRDAGSAPDAGFDAGRRDGGPPGPDGAPPPPVPPNPATCRIEPTIEPFRSPRLETRWPDGPMDHMSSVHVSSTPVVIDPDPDDGIVQPIVAFPSYATLRGEERGILRMWNPATHETVSWPAEGELGQLEATGNVAAGDLDGDGDVEFVAMGVFSGSYAVHHDGTLLWESPYPTARDRGIRFERTIGTAITLADLEGDGTVEVVAGRNVLEGLTGERRWVGDSATTTRGTNNFLGPISCVADLDGDGVQEVIAGRTAFRADGTILWNQETLPDGLCAVADFFDDSPGPEVALVSRGYIYLLAATDGEVLWSRFIEGPSPFGGIGGAPTIADFDGDDRPELGIAHGGKYGVYDPECVRAGVPAGCVANGLLWTLNSDDSSSSGTGSSVFDFNGDGRAEVVYNDQQYFRVIDGVSGRPLFEHRNSSRTRTENPVIADVDNDGDAEIIFSANAEAFFIRDFWTDPGVEIWGDRRGNWVGARRVWNQHAYHITNVDESGHIGSPEAPSWEGLNAYRQNLREGGDVLVVPDVWGSADYECAGPGRARIALTVANYGLERVGAGIVIGLYRGEATPANLVATGLTTRTLEPNGDSEVVVFEVELFGEVVDYLAVLDDPNLEDGGAIAECREGNNTVLIWRPVCL